MIVVDDVHITYKVFASGKRTSAADARFDIRSGGRPRGLKEVHAVRGISFTASEGETIGVVGHNGSGKSTLFSAISGLIPASAGAVWARERPVLLGVNAALLPQLSGENNIKLGLMAMGFTAREAAARVDEIADFAELNEFIHLPMRTYSAGMGARLRFAIGAARAHSILLIDEALSVGDRKFRTKSEHRIKELRDSAGTVMIVSHSTNTLLDVCSRVLWVHKGELRADGAPKDVIRDYLAWTKNPESTAVGAHSVNSAKSPAGSRARPGGDTAPSDPKPDEAVATALVSTTATVPTTADASTQSPRTVARRDRFRRKVRGRRRRTIITIGLTALGLVLAVVAGAAVAALARTPAPPAAVRTTAPVSSSEEASPPVIHSFTVASPTVECPSEDGSVDVDFAWRVEDATLVAIGAGGAGSNAFEQPIDSGLPASSSGYRAAFPCNQPSHEYTLTAAGRGGTVVNATVRVERSPLPQASPSEEPQRPQSPRSPNPQPAPQQPAPEQPAPQQPDGPAPQPSEEPTTNPVPTETPEPPAPAEPESTTPSG